MRLSLRLVVLLAMALSPGAAAPPQPDGISRAVLALEDALKSGSAEKFGALVAQNTSTGKFAALMRGPRTHAVVRERDRNPGSGGAVDLLLDTFVERGPSGQIATWRVTVRPAPGAGDAFVFTDFTELSAVDGLYRLALGTQAFDARGLIITSTDYSLQMRTGMVFVAEAQGGPTALVLRGRGEMVFTPQDPAEQRQVEILSKDTSLRVPFEDAFVRLNPGELDKRIGNFTLTPRASGQGDYNDALEVFEFFAGKTYTLDLHDLSRERWSLVPAYGDMVAEVRTKKYGPITYAQSAGEAEDISLFQRDQRRNISVYASPAQLALRGRFFSEDELADYDIDHHDVDVRFTPAREWIDGTARLRARVRRQQLSTMTLRLAESLVVRSVVAKGHGRLMHLRVVGQNNLIVTLPAPAARGEVIELEVRYSGRLAAQQLDREAITVSAPQELDPVIIPPEPRWIYSNRSYWYPQSPVTDFSTARVRIAVPQPWDVIATGIQTGGAEPVDDAPAAGPMRAFTFETKEPARYLSCVISKFVPVLSRTMKDPSAGTLNVIASPRQVGRARNVADQAEQIFSFYRSLVGDAPYPQLTVAVSESDLPGGHSPAYFVLLNQTLPSANITWRADPVSFENFPAFFLAHEVAHQWWGQSVGWKNYHEQWISEGFSQYFAALFAGEQKGPESLANLMRQMRRWALEESDEGPIYLGYRLGHVQGDSRVFRALVYNKAAVVLHMLRRLVGDDRFFAGLRKFYAQSKFGKAGTDDFRRVMEAETGLNLERFFERWIHGFGVPAVKVAHRVETSPGGERELVIDASQSELVYDLPITIAIEHETGARREVLLLLTDRSTQLRVPLDSAAGQIRRVVVDSDAAALARFVR